MASMVEVALKGLRDIAADFKNPDDDFEPYVFFENGETGDYHLLPAAQFMRNDTSKDLLAEFVIPQAIRKFHSPRVVTVFSAYALLTADPDYFTNDEPRPSQHPDRVEVVVVTEMTADGITQNLTAYIDRDPRGVDPPSLGEFVSNFGVESVDESKYEGRFVSPVIRTLKEIQDA